MDWTRRYLAIPHIKTRSGFDGADCFGLCQLIWREERGRELPPALPYTETGPAARHHLTDCVVQGRSGYRSIEAAEPFALIVFHLGGYPIHIGLAVDDANFIHTTRTTGVLLEDLTSPAWSKRIEGFYVPH